MSAVIQDDEASAGGVCDELGGFERDWILASMRDQRVDRNLIECSSEIEVTETSPNALLNSADDAERSEIASAGRVGKVSRNTELERAVAIGLGVSFAESRLSQLGAKTLDGGPLLSSRELGLELLAKGFCDGGWINED